MVVDSSLWEEPYYVRILFMTMVALKDADHVVRGDAFRLSKKANMTEREVLDGLVILSSPDLRKLSPQPFEGRRIEKVDQGWLILNGAKYRSLIKLYDRRYYKAGKMREYRQRDRKKKPGVMGKGTQHEQENIKKWADGEQPEPMP
jgi:hypothetical protein